MAAPTLFTDRLVLMPLGPADLDEVAALLADPEVMRHVDGGMRSRPETADLLASAERNWKKWMIRRAIGVAIGMALAFGIYLHAKHTVSRKMLEKALEVPAMIEIPQSDLPEARSIVTVAHEIAFDTAFSPDSLMGKGFDAEAYLDELFTQAASEATSRGRQDLANAFQHGRKRIEVGIGAP